MAKTKTRMRGRVKHRARKKKGKGRTRRRAYKGGAHDLHPSLAGLSCFDPVMQTSVPLVDLFPSDTTSPENNVGAILPQPAVGALPAVGAPQCVDLESLTPNRLRLNLVRLCPTDRDWRELRMGRYPDGRVLNDWLATARVEGTDNYEPVHPLYVNLTMFNIPGAVAKLSDLFKYFIAPAMLTQPSLGGENTLADMGVTAYMPIVRLAWDGSEARVIKRGLTEVQADSNAHNRFREEHVWNDQGEEDPQRVRLLSPAGQEYVDTFDIQSALHCGDQIMKVVEVLPPLGIAPVGPAETDALCDMLAAILYRTPRWSNYEDIPLPPEYVQYMQGAEVDTWAPMYTAPAAAEQIPQRPSDSVDIQVLTRIQALLAAPGAENSTITTVVDAALAAGDPLLTNAPVEVVTLTDWANWYHYQRPQEPAHHRDRDLISRLIQEDIVPDPGSPQLPPLQATANAEVRNLVEDLIVRLDELEANENLAPGTPVDMREILEELAFLHADNEAGIGAAMDAVTTGLPDPALYDVNENLRESQEARDRWRGYLQTLYNQYS